MNSEANTKNRSSNLIDVNLGRYFVFLAEDAEKSGDRHLAEHFIEIAMELFDDALQASSETGTRGLSIRQLAGHDAD